MSEPKQTPPSEPTGQPEPAMDANLTPEQHATPEDPLAVALAELAVLQAKNADLADQFLRAKADGARFLYVLPNFQNPTGRTMTEARRAAVARFFPRQAGAARHRRG